MKNRDEAVKAFEDFLNREIKKGIPENTIAVNFNIYEHYAKNETDSHYFWLEFTCSDRFDMENEDWACYTIFESEGCFKWDEDSEWEDAEKTAQELVINYLETGKYSEMLKALKGVALGFAEGDLILVYPTVKNYND